MPQGKLPKFGTFGEGFLVWAVSVQPGYAGSRNCPISASVSERRKDKTCKLIQFREVTEVKEVEKNVLYALLQVLVDKNLITQDTCEKAKTKILGTLDGPDFFCYCEEERKEESHGHTQNSR